MFLESRCSVVVSEFTSPRRLSGRPSLNWVPDMLWESKGGRRDADHITHRVPMVNEKYRPNTVLTYIPRGMKGYLYFFFYFLISCSHFHVVTLVTDGGSGLAKRAGAVGELLWDK